MSIIRYTTYSSGSIVYSTTATTTSVYYRSLTPQEQQAIEMEKNKPLVDKLKNDLALIDQEEARRKDCDAYQFEMERVAEESGYTDFMYRGEDNYCIAKFLFTYPILVNIDNAGYENRYCYHTYEEAKFYLMQWRGDDFAGIPDGWHRELSTDARRLQPIVPGGSNDMLQYKNGDYADEQRCNEIRARMLGEI